MKTKRKILIIEDDQFIRELYVRELQKSNYDVTTTTTAEEAEKIIKKEKFDLILVDIMLPGKSGLDMLQHFHEVDGTKGASFIMLTNIGQDAVVKQGLELGAKGYLIKSSFSPQQIVEEINNYFER